MLRSYAICPAFNAVDALHATMTHCVASEVMAGFTHAGGGVSHPQGRIAPYNVSQGLHGKDLAVFDMVHV